jgi:hypothetical protein
MVDGVSSRAPGSTDCLAPLGAVTQCSREGVHADRVVEECARCTAHRWHMQPSGRRALTPRWERGGAASKDARASGNVAQHHGVGHRMRSHFEGRGRYLHGAPSSAAGRRRLRPWPARRHRPSEALGPCCRLGGSRETGRRVAEPADEFVHLTDRSSRRGVTRGHRRTTRERSLRRTPRRA